MQYMYTMQRIFTEVSSSLLLLVKEHQYSHRFKTVVCHFSDIAVIRLGMSLKTACFCVDICLWTQNMYVWTTLVSIPSRLSCCKAFEDEMNVSTSLILCYL